MLLDSTRTAPHQRRKRGFLHSSQGRTICLLIIAALLSKATPHAGKRGVVGRAYHGRVLTNKVQQRLKGGGGLIPLGKQVLEGCNKLLHSLP